MKFKSKTNKKLLVSFGLLSCVGLVTLPIISCSKNNVVSLNEQQINEQFSKFYNSIEKSNIKNNLYFENFNFDNQTNKAILSVDEIGNIISIEKLSNAYQYQFELTKNIEEKTIEIEMKMQLKNSTNNSFLNPLNQQYKIKKIENVKSLDDAQKNNLNSIYQNWKTNGANSLTITNINSKAELKKENYKDVLPSYLSLNNIDLNFNNFQNTTPANFVFDFNYNFNNVNGSIDATLDVLNKETQLKYYVDNFEEVSQIQITGFANEKDRNTEIQNLYDTLSETFNLKTILDGKQIPFLASGVTTKQDVINLFNAIKTIKPNPNIDKILEIINNTNNQNQWYEISLTTSASDTIGNIIIDWTIADKFTGYKIRPEYITKTTTINDMLQLVNSDDQGNKNYGIIDNVYQAYQIFSKLNLTNINSQLASSMNETINNDWLLNSTNIRQLLPNITTNNSNNGYLEFDLTTNQITSKFRLKLEGNINKISNDISGILRIPFVLEIKVENSNFNETNNWIKVLPPNGKSGVGENVSYNSAVREAYIQVGGFLTKDTQVASLIYGVFNQLANKTLTIEIEDKSYFEYLKQRSEKEIPTILENEINNFIQSKISDPNQQNEISDFLKKYSLSFGFTDNQGLKYDQTNKTISTNQVSLKILNSSDNFVIDFYESGQKKEFPMVQISIKLKQSTTSK
ncbi:MAG: hypothetical protein IKB83_00770 [Mycoplasmataceae bacterium]|nr:hypothetical protein [Mycoplasmataceae bacterium]